MQCVHDPKHRNVVNINNIKREASRHLTNEGRNISKLKPDELETNIFFSFLYRARIKIQK